MSENYSVTDSQVQGKRNSQMQKNYFTCEQGITYLPQMEKAKKFRIHFV